MSEKISRKTSFNFIMPRRNTVKVQNERKVWEMVFESTEELIYVFIPQLQRCSLGESQTLTMFEKQPSVKARASSVLSPMF